MTGLTLEQGLGLGASELRGLILLQNRVESLLEIASKGGAVLTDISLLGQANLGCSITNDSNLFGLRVKLGGADLDLALSCRVCPGCVREVN